MMSNAKRILLVLLVLAAGSAFAQTPRPLSLPNQPLRSTGLIVKGHALPDGRRIVSGEFAWIDGEATSGNLHRLTANGRLDRAWWPAADEAQDSYSFAADEFGSVYVVHSNRTRIVKLSAVDGSVVPVFQATATTIAAIEVRGGWLYASGDWTLPGGARSSMVRLSLDSGSPDPGFAPQLDADWVGAFAFDPGGRIYVARTGGFSRILPGGQVDSSWAGPYLGYLSSMAASGDALYVSVEDEFPENWRVRKLLGVDGSIDRNFSGAVIGRIDVLHVVEDGGIWVGGSLRQVNGTNIPTTGILRLRPDGQMDADRSPPCLCSVLDIGAGPESGTLDLYGSILELGNAPRLGLAQLTQYGAVLPPIGSVEAVGSSSSIVRQPGGGILVGGSFFKVGSHVTYNVARFKPDGTIDRSFASRTWTSGRALAISPIDESIFVGGYGGDNGGNLAKLRPDSGATVEEWTADAGYPGPSTLAASDDGFLYVGGEISTINGVARSGLGRVSQTGSGVFDAAWQLVPSPGSTRSLLLDGMRSIYLTSNARVARYDIASGARLWDLATLGSFNRLALGGSRLFASGIACAPVQPGVQDRRCAVVRLDAASGSVDPGWSFAPATERPGQLFGGSGMTFTASGEMIVGGYYDAIDASSDSYLWRVDPAGNGTPAAGWRPSARFPRVVLSDAPNRIWLAGNFTEVSGVPRYGIAAVPIDTPDEMVFVDDFE